MRTTRKSALKSLVFICLGLTITTIAFADPFDPPGPPGTPLYDNFWSSGCDLSYTAPKTDGGSPITIYIIEYKSTSDYFSKWVIKGTSTTLKYHAIRMIKGSSGIFRVRAENKAGAGEPSEPSYEIIFKDR